MQELYQRFQQLRGEYPSLKSKCEAEVTTWKWATFCRHDPRPFYYERERWKPGRLLKTAPSNPDGKYEYGYDDLDQVLVERQYVGAIGSFPVRYYENFSIYTSELVESALFSYDSGKEPINCRRISYSGNQLALWESFGRRGCSRERYFWKNGKVILIEFEHAEFMQPSEFTELKPYQRIEPKYNNLGLLDEIVMYQYSQVRENPKAFTAYRRLEKEISLKKLLSLAHEKLLANIIQRLTAIDLEESVYCLAIAWSPGQFSSLPPSIKFGLNREREQWLSGYGNETKCYLWNPAEFSSDLYDELLLDDDELLNVCDLLNQECGRCNRWGDVRKLLNEVAKSLNEFDWSKYLNTTPDFVVYATDLEQVDLRRNLEISIPPELFAQFEENNWLP